MKNLLLIDDDQQFSHFFATATKSMGMNCKVINESKNIMLFDLKPIEHIIIDLLMPRDRWPAFFLTFFQHCFY